MSDKISMQVLGFDYDLDYGFASIKLANSTTVSCSLESKRSGFIKEIDADFVWDSATGNDDAYNIYGKEFCLSKLYDEAQKHGFKVIGNASGVIK
jgi:hypothetical protein